VEAPVLRPLTGADWLHRRETNGVARNSLVSTDECLNLSTSHCRRTDQWRSRSSSISQ